MPGTQFLYPINWNPQAFLGSMTINTIGAATGGRDGTATAKIEWTADKIPPATGWHPCLVYEIMPMEVDPSGLHRVNQNKKLAQRNLTIIDPPMRDEPGWKGDFMFVYEFTVGHAALQKQVIRLDLLAEKHPDNVHLLLELAGLVDGITEVAKDINVNIPISIGQMPTGESGVQAIPRLDRLPKPSDHPEKTSLVEKYKIIGLSPALINGVPPLQVVIPEKAGLTISIKDGQSPVIRLIGIVSPYENNGQVGLYHLRESNVNGDVLGGTSLQVNT